ncbi:protein unc-45 homolog B [Harmonia axyridis]|uniref:protein unc-45 homolog B n=1 Tax=Harmonia axyridis TaxID=115357 RepID=UPI001E27545C|nr:protein unc-45 homolog B [Harmonia axyridis]
MITGDIKDAEKYKEQGNESFKNGNFVEALEFYTKAIKLVNEEGKDSATYYKNRAATHLKLENYEEVVKDCDKCLKLVPSDPKALYRRCQALEKLERFEEAYRDATQIFKDDPNNKAIQPNLERLYRIVQERERKNAQTTTKLESMSKIAFEFTENIDKRETAMKNLLVLAREGAGSTLMVKSTVIQQIKRLLKVEKNEEIRLTAIRVIGELFKHSSEKTKKVLHELGLPWFLDMLDSKTKEQVDAIQYCLQAILNSLSGMKNVSDSKPDKELIKTYEEDLNLILTFFINNLTNRLISGIARDAIIELLIRNVHYTALDWALQLVEQGGVERLLQCTSELEEFKYESSMNITHSTSTVAAMCLQRIYENMYYDKAKEKFMGKIEDYVKEKLLSPDMESKVRVVATITSLLRGPLDVGNAIVGKEGIMQMILVMANTEDVLQQKVACECIIAAASRADKAKAIIAQGVDILKKLYTSKDDGVRLRALVGLCKLGSSAGTDASMRPFAEGSNIKLAEACRRFMLKPGKDLSFRKWATEGLAYLTLDAEVKEKLIEDKACICAMIELARTGDESCLYGVITTLMNLLNAYEEQEVLPEMVELAKFAKQHIPEKHELDDPDFITKRVIILGKLGVTSALVALSKTESENSRESISRVFNALCSEQELRGIVVAQGGVKALISLASKGTEKGKVQACQALARIGITMDPEVAFPGQRCLEVIRPLIHLLHPDRKGLENFEGLMAICNLAQVSESVRQKILKEGGLSRIDHYLFEDHEYLCRAATQCMTNMAMSPDVVKIYEGPNDRTKMMVSLAMDEDLDTSMAASGCLAILTGSSNIICTKLFESQNWLHCLQILLANPKPSIQYRGLCMVSNIIDSSKENAEKLISTNVMEILLALSKLPEETHPKVAKTAEEILKAAEKLGIIKKPDEDI